MDSLSYRDLVPLEIDESKTFVDFYTRSYPDVIIQGSGAEAKRGPRQAQQFKKLGYLPGWPDFQICEARAGYAGLFIEMKRRKNSTVQKNQKAMHEKLRAKGYCVIVCKGADEAIQVLTEYMLSPPCIVGVYCETAEEIRAAGGVN